MSKLLDRWKQQTAIMVKNTGAIAASTGLEMMFYIAELEQKISELEGRNEMDVSNKIHPSN
jgi:tetrahydromethanopterin S-methyltransferase subunit B